MGYARDRFRCRLLLVLLAVVQVTLWTDAPRRWVVPIVERELGLRVAARGLSSGWFGGTVLRDVTVSLPLADDSFVTIPTLRVSHTWLVPLLFGRELRIESITVDRPEINVRQDPAGRWNLLEAAELIARTAGKKPAQEQGERARTALALPALRIESATVRVIDNQSREARVAPLNVTGIPSGPLVYRYDVRVPDRLAATGELVPGGAWQHEVKLVADNISDLIKPFYADWPADSHLEASWRGQADSGLRGRLTLASLRAGSVSAGGFVDAHVSNNRIELRPQALLMNTADGLAPEARAEAGVVLVEGPIIRAESLRLATGGGIVELTGNFNRSEHTAAVQAQWNDVSLPAGTRQSGRIDATLRAPWPGKPKVDAQVTSSGALADGNRWTRSSASTARVRTSITSTGWQQSRRRRGRRSAPRRFVTLPRTFRRAIRFSRSRT
jgi:hypothetical protein